MLDDTPLQLLAQVLPQLQQTFSLPAAEAAPLPPEALSVLQQVASRMADNYPYFHPLYAGQMLKPPHPIAHAAYALAMFLNPNNHALDGGRASSAMEIEAVRALAALFGWTEYLGHLTSGGTFANLEALWIAGQIHPGQRILASHEAHYTHARISDVLGLRFASVASDAHGRMDLRALEAELEKGGVGTVVATLGTTALGAVDPLDELMALRERYGFRIHADAAYGGYFLLARNLAQSTRRAFDCLHRVDSIVIDPHKHGLQPYGCGCVLFRDPAVGRFYKHDSPYTYFTSGTLHLGEISLECSRAGASAVALWATQQLLPLAPGSVFAKGLEAGRRAALSLHAQLAKHPRFAVAFPPELDIVIWAVRGTDAAHSSALAQRVFERAAARDLHLALVRLPARLFGEGIWPGEAGEESVTCLRSVLMKPEHEKWVPEIFARLRQATAEAVGEPV